MGGGGGGGENKLTTFSTWTIVLGCNESNIHIPYTPASTIVCCLVAMATNWSTHDSSRVFRETRSVVITAAYVFPRKYR